MYRPAWFKDHYFEKFIITKKNKNQNTSFKTNVMALPALFPFSLKKHLFSIFLITLLMEFLYEGVVPPEVGN